MSADTCLIETECGDKSDKSKDYPRQTQTGILLVIRAAVKQEESLTDYIKHVYIFYKNSTTFLFTRVIMFLAAIVIFVTGLMRYHHCDMEPEIPLFLVLEGAGIILKTGIFAIKSCNNRSPSDDSERSTLDTCTDVTSLFLVLWTLSGSVWVFGTYRRVDLTHEANSYYCDKLVYMCALSYLLLIYTYVTVMALCLAALCLYHRYKHRTTTDNPYNNFT